MLEIFYSEIAIKQFKKIAKGDKKAARMIFDTIEKFASNPNGNFDIKNLKGEFGNFKRLRVGNYRILFDNEGHVLNIFEIKHRQEAYHD